MAPACQIAKSRIVHSNRVRDMIATWSPLLMPAAISPFATPSTSWSTWVVVYSRQTPFSCFSMSTLDGDSVACAMSRSLMLADGSDVTARGTWYSSILAPVAAVGGKPTAPRYGRTGRFGDASTRSEPCGDPRTKGTGEAMTTIGVD